MIIKAHLLSLLFLFSFSYLSAQESSSSEEWCTYTNNNNPNVGTDGNTGIVVDNKNNVYIIKATNSLVQNLSLGSLSKFSSEGDLLWTTASFGRTFGLAIDHSGDIIIAGYTNREEGIATTGPFQESYVGGNGDSFLMKFDEYGNKIWGTYFGGTSYESSHTPIETHYMGLEIDAENNIFWTFGTQSDDMATTNIFQEQRNGAKYLISKFNPQGQRLWATYYGTDQVQVHSISGLQVDESAVYIAGYVHNKDIVNSYFDTGVIMFFSRKLTPYLSVNLI